MTSTCPIELQKTGTIEYEGFKCRVAFNYVGEGELGIIPFNVWTGQLQLNDQDLRWDCFCKESCKTIEDAVKVIEPSFKIVMDRALAKEKETHKEI